MSTYTEIDETHNFLVQVSIKCDHYMINLWDYVKSFETKEDAFEMCDGLYDESIHKVQISDINKNEVLKVWR